MATLAVGLALPYALGFEATDARVLFHSLFGCFFYGMFVTKMLLLSKGSSPVGDPHRWRADLLRAFFGLVFVWLTSALWFFETTGITF
jgi:hypothetical protein